jgi:hypothetical protein
MFSVGQKLWHRRGHPSGTVLECDGDRVYLLQDNGAEIDFDARDLSPTPPAAAPGEVAQREAKEAAGYHVPTRLLTPREITPEHERVLANIPVRTLQAVAALHEKATRDSKFSSLDTAGKLNAITDMTDIPYRVIRTYLGRPGELGLLLGKGIAARTTS